MRFEVCFSVLDKDIIKVGGGKRGCGLPCVKWRGVHLTKLPTMGHSSTECRTQPIFLHIYV